MSDEHLQKHDGAGNSNQQVVVIAMIGVILVGLCAVVFLGFQLFRPGGSSLFAELFPTPTLTRVPTNTPAPTRIPATQQAWVKPAQSPSIASADEAQSAYDSGGVYLEAFASDFPEMPEVNQPGDVYVFDVPMFESNPLLWSYGWCTTTSQILDDNFRSIKLEFVMNETVVPLSNFTVVEYSREDGSPCRETIGLVKTWTPGRHQLETRVTFTQSIHDGWNLYPAGTHVFKYLVTLNP